MSEIRIPDSLEGRNTPQVFTDLVSGPFGRFLVAPFLKLVRFEQKFQTYVVISAGKMVGFASKGATSWVIPAGLILQAAAYKSAFDGDGGTDNSIKITTARNVTGLDKYTSVDVDNGLKDANGDAVAEGVPVVEAFFTSVSLAGAQDTSTLEYAWTLTGPTGAIIYNALRHFGGQGNPVDYTYLNFKPQNGVAFTRIGDMELPAVSDIASLKMTGMTVAYITGSDYISGTDVLRTVRGLPLTYNMSSDFEILTNSATQTKVGIINDCIPLSEMPVNYTNYVQNGQTTLPDQFKMAGSATGGLDNNVFLAGSNAIGKLYFSMQIV